MPEPGCSYFSCSAPNRIMAAFTAKTANSAPISVTPLMARINQIMIEELSEYSAHRK